MGPLPATLTGEQPHRAGPWILTDHHSSRHLLVLPALGLGIPSPLVNIHVYISDPVESLAEEVSWCPSAVSASVAPSPPTYSGTPSFLTSPS